MATKVEDRSETPPPVPPAPMGRRWWERALRALPAIAFLATFGFFFVDKNEAARSVFSSGRGILTLVAITGGYVVIAIVLKKFVRWSWVAPVVLTGVVLGLAAWTVRPYYVDETDDTRLFRGPVADASDIATSVPSTSAAAPPAAPGTPPAPPPPPPAPPPVAVRVASGSIQGLAGHDGSGEISLIREPNGSFVVRFENFAIEGTPAPVVYLIEGGDQRNPGGVSLGGLRGNQGTASDYSVPSDAAPAAGWTVLVWCETFATPIVNATLNPA